MRTKNKIKEKLLKFPFFHRLVYHSIKKIKGITLNYGGVTNEELNLLLKYAGKGRICMEIGVFAGQTTRILSKYNFVMCIDPFKEDLLNVYREYPQDVYKRFIDNTIGNKILLFPLTSKDALDFWNNNVKSKILDLIFIDGLHTIEGVSIDFKWCKYLKKNGVVAFHDTHLEEIDSFIKKNLINLKLIANKLKIIC